MGKTYKAWQRERACERKIGWHCELDANAAILRAYERGEPPLHKYTCGHCGLIHLTKNDGEG